MKVETKIIKFICVECKELKDLHLFYNSQTKQLEKDYSDYVCSDCFNKSNGR